jgi:hypothetical protein
MVTPLLKFACTEIHDDFLRRKITSTSRAKMVSDPISAKSLVEITSENSVCIKHSNDIVARIRHVEAVVVDNDTDD